MHRHSIAAKHNPATNIRGAICLQDVSLHPESFNHIKNSSRLSKPHRHHALLFPTLPSPCHRDVCGFLRHHPYLVSLRVTRLSLRCDSIYLRYKNIQRTSYLLHGFIRCIRTTAISGTAAVPLIVVVSQVL